MEKRLLKQKLIAAVLVLVLVLALNLSTVSAANGDLTIEAAGVTFTNDVVSVSGSGSIYDAYFCYGQLPNSTNFSSVSTIFIFTGTTMKINGVQIPSGSTSPYTTTVDFTGLCTVEVVWSGGSRIYYVSAYPSTFTATMNLEYENARTFSQQAVGSTYGTSGMLDPISATQKTTATNHVSSMDTMCSSMPNFTPAQYKTYSTLVDGGDTPYELMVKFQSARTNFSFTGSSSYISAVGALDANSTGRYLGGGYGTGGWMYEVTRGTLTIIPMIGINGWKLASGDIVTWKYTCDYGYDVGAPMW